MRFVQVLSHVEYADNGAPSSTLLALDDDGRVWRYSATAEIVEGRLYPAASWVPHAGNKTLRESLRR